MCGIFGYQGKNHDAQKILVHGLERLEYRGYDSAGLLVGNKKGEIKLIKAVGKVSHLANKVAKEISDKEHYTFGIAHTRRATHGGVTEENTHPHHDMNKHFYLVHNGIIENYHKLKQDLLVKGYTFYGETDSEIVANLLEDNWTGNFMETVEKVLGMIRGAYALLIVSTYAPDEIIAVKLGSPLLFAYTGKDEFFFSSDKQALAGYADKLIYLDDGDIVHLKGQDYQIKSNGISMERKIEDMDLASLESSKGDYKHFMLKEIFEQPNIIRRIFKGRVDFNQNFLKGEAFHGMQDEHFKKIVFVGCGTSYNAGCLGTYRMENLAGMDSSCEISSEYEYKNIKVNDDTLYVFISQSGETADSIEVLKIIKQKGGHTFGIVNVVGSTISRLTDHGLFTRCGAEIGVASTKAFTAQITCILLLALYLGQKRGLSKAKYDKVMRELSKVPVMIEDILADTANIRKIAQEITQYKNFFFLGRHYQLPIARESSLKLKEITYLHSESYPSGELKHGPLALIEASIPSVLFTPNDLMFEKNISSIQEIKARDGKVITISDKDIHNADRNIQVPSTIDEIYPFLTAVAGQLLAYHVADILGKDIDKPRNLAKSVTVK
ncbi:MAG: glutamine--fructose-6-phosphate transaminase (isomerizing) [Candidatus Absconditabacterales bacterium]